MTWPVRFSQWLGRALLPPRCLVCGLPGDGDQDLCGACRADLPWNHPACPQCALPLPLPRPGSGSEPDPAADSGPRPRAHVDGTATARAASRFRCGRCLRRPPPLDATVAALSYRFPLDRLLPRFKFHGDLAAGRLLAELMAAGLAPRLVGTAWPGALVPVPLHPTRLRQRGYDQALELARPVAATLGVRLCTNALRRVRATEAQTTLGAAARRGNLEGAFAARAGSLPPHVALIDDVMTTGATLGECARALRRAGVSRVDAWVLARAPSPGRGDQPSA